MAYATPTCARGTIAQYSMSIINYIRKEKSQEGQFLPSSSSFTKDLSSVVRAVNERVGNLSSEIPPSKRRKVGERHVYSPRKRASIGKYAAFHGPQRASLHFQTQLGHSVHEDPFEDL